MVLSLYLETRTLSWIIYLVAPKCHHIFRKQTCGEGGRGHVNVEAGPGGMQGAASRSGEKPGPARALEPLAGSAALPPGLQALASSTLRG